jgi:DNA-binding SARP family transcriptional activator/Tfp pilus assembly protein PilF
MPVTKSSTRPVRVRALGALSVRVGEHAELTQPRRLALFIYLLLAEPRGMHSRETLMALLWPESGADQARQALRNSLHAIRRTLGDDVVVTSGNDLVGVSRDVISCDVDDLLETLRAGHVTELGAGSVELLSGFHVDGAPAFERWLDDWRSDVRSRVTTTLLARARDAQGRGDRDEAATLARAAHLADSGNEPILRESLEILATTGDVSGALRLYRDFTARLSREFDAEPAAETTKMIVALTARRFKPGHANVWQASTCCVRGTYLFLRASHVGGSVQDLHDSRDLFERALAIDPTFALAHAGLSNYFAVSAARGLLRPFAEYFGRAIELSHQALALDVTLAVPHVHFAVQAMFLDSDWPRAGEELRRAVALDPYYAEARRFLGIYLGAMGMHEEGLAELREAVRLEPHIPANRNSVGDALLALGRYEEAIVELRECLRLHSGYRAAADRLLRCLERMGDFPAAVEHRGTIGPTQTAEAFAGSFARDGRDGYRRERDRELRSEISALEGRLGGTENPGDLFNPPELQIALAYAELGDMTRAREYEERAAEIRPGKRQWFRGRPELAEPLPLTRG